ncbi:MAG: hypothetical protein PWQ59_425 [Thermoanaerobacterium sp.]|nr:hypothetical protein [Thermoanaerobacterium sp.]
MTLKESIKLILKSGYAPLLVGPAGVGKTELVKEIAKEEGRDCIILNLSVMEPGDLLGLPSDTNKEKTVYLKPEWFPEKEHSIVFIDEINRSNPLVRAGVMQLILDKRIMNNILPADTWIISAMNPNEDDQGEYEVDDFSDPAFLDRFVPLKFQPTLREWTDWTKKNEIKYIPDFMNQEITLWEMTQRNFEMPTVPITPRTLERMDKITQKAFVEFTDVDHVIKVLEPITISVFGPKISQKYLNYLKEKQKEVITLEDIYSGKFKTMNVAVADNLLELVTSVTTNFFNETKEFVYDKLSNVIDFLKLVPPETAGIFYRVIYERYEELSNKYPLMFENTKFSVESSRFLSDTKETQEK